MTINPTFGHRGWECPKCGHVYAPTVAMCWRCPQSSGPSTATATVWPCRTDGGTGCGEMARVHAAIRAGDPKEEEA